MDTFMNMTKALSDGSRVRVLVALLCHKQMCVCQIVELLGLAIPTVSRHMAVLQGARLVQSRKDGRWVYYMLSMEFPEQLRQWLEASLLSTEEIKADQIVLNQILTSKVKDLCIKQKERKACNE